MKTRRRDRVLVSPRRARDIDVDALNRIFAEAFTDRYRRDGLVGVRVPRLNPAIWRYALHDAGDGAMLWCDEEHEIVAFNIAHQSGVEGWMGPLAVRTDRQGRGVGKTVVQTAVDWLKQHDARTIGLETMPRTIDNIGFYSRLGFVPGNLTVTLVGDVRPGGDATAFGQMSTLAADERDTMLEACRRRLERSAPGYDFTREHVLTEELGIGDTVVVGVDGVAGFALWHSASLVESKEADEIRVLKLFADSTATFEALVAAVENCARRAGIRSVAVRCQTTFGAAYQALVRRGYRVRWTDLRMTLERFPEPGLPDGEVLLSNWEI